MNLTACWILLCAFLNCLGWALSAAHVLNRVGYIVGLLGLVAAVWARRRELGVISVARRQWPRLRARFRRLFPAAFLGLAALAMLGGIIHPPSNYDALAYRIPRVLHWLAEGQWHWIHTDFPRLNTRICGIEWVSAPMIALLKTDRFLFLLNSVSFLLLPGLVFGLLHRLGVRRKVAWYWMWLFPCGYGYALQAGSIANDMFGAVFALAAIDFALRAKETRKLKFAVLSILGAALLTSAKSSNLPLLLPWLIALLPSWRMLVSRPTTLAATLFIAAGASFLPTAALNIKYCGDWTGLSVESAIVRSNQPLLRLAVNLIGLGTQNLVPPIFPFASKWNAMMDESVPPDLARALEGQFEKAAARFWLGEMQMEEGAGLGCGLTVLLGAAAVWRLLTRRGCRSSGRSRSSLAAAVWLGTVAAVVVILVTSGLSGVARYFLPHYVILTIPILGGQKMEGLMQARWWRVLAILSIATTTLLVVVTPPRPLWPAVTILRNAGATASAHRLLQRAWAVYSVYGNRADSFAPAREMLPVTANPLGMMTFDDPETSLWRPFGSRRIRHVTGSDSVQSVRERNIEYILVSATVLETHHQMTIEDLIHRLDGELVQTFPLFLRAGTGVKDWYLVRIRENADAQ